MESLYFIERIGSSTYQDFIDNKVLVGRIDIDEDDLDELAVSLEDYGITLIFNKKNSILTCVEIQNIDSKNNMLPPPLEINTVRNDVLKSMGEPVFSQPPEKIFSLFTGGVDQYNWVGDKSLALLVYYNYEGQTLKAIKIKPQDSVFWGEG